MEQLLAELELMIADAKSNRKKCWPDDTYEKGLYDGMTNALQEVRHYIKSNNLHLEL